MPIEYISTDQTTTYNVDAADDLFVLQGVSVYATGDAIQAAATNANNGINITVQGGLYGTTAIDLFQNSLSNSNTMIYVGSEGHLHGTQDGITLRPGDDNAVINYGEITAQQAGVYVQGGEARMTNHGSITSFGNSSQGAIIFAASGFGSNIREVTNTGIIDGAPSNDGATVYSTISNTLGAEFTLNNSGAVLADGANAVFSSATLNVIENTGLIDGQVNLFNTANVFNSGSITGDVTLSTDADSYTGVGAGVVSGLLDLNSGDDLAQLGDVGGQVSGGSGDDTIVGGAGRDTLEGGDNSDLLRGSQGDDDIAGGAHDDTLRGGQGDDTLQGDDGDDLIRGGAGEDIVIGANGSDTLTGGADADVFVYTFATDSLDDSTRDVIADFTVGEDLIDLSAIPGLSFIGDDGFSGTGAEVQVTDPNAIGRVKIFVDTNGDGVADMKIVLNNTTTLSEDDFIL